MADLNEPILPDDYPIYGDYLYVADGKVIRSDWHGVTAAEFKRKIGAKELRRCDLVGRFIHQSPKAPMRPLRESQSR